MREIKFRAWDGKIMHDVGELCWSVGGIKFYGPGAGKGVVEANPKYDWKVDSILMQYTGLKDKNGKEIYEGDIVNVNDFTLPVLREIVFAWGGFSTSQNDVIMPPSQDMEIIGNIHENPELAKIEK